MKETRVGFGYYWPPINAKHYVLACLFRVNLQLRLMPSVVKRKQKNVQIARRKEKERDKEAKKKQLRRQLPPKGKKR